jgi:hypothetical protein
MAKLLERIVMSIEPNCRAIESVKGSMDRMNDSFKGLQRTMEEIKYEIKESREESRKKQQTRRAQRIKHNKQSTENKLHIRQQTSQ